MKFQIEIQGKDSISEGVSRATMTQMKNKGISEDDAAWDEKFEKEADKLEAFVTKFLIDGEGGDDSVVVEFDTEAKTCVVVPVKRKRSN